MQYSYNNFGNNGMQPMYQQPMYQQQPMQMQPNYQMQMQQPVQQNQMNYFSLTYINGLEQAKSFIVQPNSVIYLKDETNGVLYEKRADMQGNYSLVAYNLVKVNDLNNAGKPIPTNTITKEEFKEFENGIYNSINKLSNMVEKLSKSNSNYQKRGND